ncbi:MAG: hypothetical protein H6Q59_1018 [Firmicutes bacterium]|nr:hypothetical protein [Bacillota bacterium]
MNKKKIWMKLMLLLVLVMIGVIYQPKQVAFAASPVQICAVSYTDESILVFVNGNSKIYFATEMDAARNIWDVMEVTSTDTLAVIDVSWLSANSENIIKIKGDGDPTQTRVILKEKPSKLNVSIDYSRMDTLVPTDKIGKLLNIMASEGNGVNPITFSDLQWRKGDSGSWMNSSTLTKELLEDYLIKGTNLYFRIAPFDDVVKAKSGTLDYALWLYTGSYAYTKPMIGTVLDSSLTYDTVYPNGTQGRRASDEVKVKIGKMATLPVTGIDGGKFTAAIKYGQEYRTTTTIAGVTTTSPYWTKVTDRLVKNLTLKTMIGGSYDGLTATTAFPQILLEIRNYSTSSASSSKIIQTNINPQRVITGSIVPSSAPANVTAANQNIYITYNGTKNINIQIPSASDDNPYEYCVVKQGGTFDLTKVSWTPITKSTIVKVLSSKALDYSKLYIRMKEVKYKPATETTSAVTYKLASTMTTFDVNYPSIPTAPKLTYVYTKGYPTTISIDVTLNTVGKMPFETKLKYVKLGTKDVPVTSSVVTPTGTIDKNLVYTMKIILDDKTLKEMVNCTSRALSIYYDNGTVDKVSSKLTIKNPTAALALTTTVLPGSVIGYTSVKVENAIGLNDTLVYAIGATQVTGLNMEDKFTTGLAFTSEADIPFPTAGQYLTIYELNAAGYVVKYKSIQINATDIKS